MPIMSALLACAIGAALGLRFKFAILFPATVVVALIALITAVDAPTWRIVLSIVLAAVTLQLGFLGGAAAQCWLLGHNRSDPARADQDATKAARPARGPMV
jgi:uncharacterized membrane protein YqjE